MGLNDPTPMLKSEKLLFKQEMSLENRHNVKIVNDVFKDNILLNMAYLRGESYRNKSVDFEKVRQPFKYEFKLEKGQTFAFHEDVLPEYKNSVVKTTNAHFNLQEGFKSDGYLVGDGVCHLASLIYITALFANLEATAPTNHNFAVIPDIPKEYGVSIYNQAGAESSNTMQNLYITNNRDNSITFRFEYQKEKLSLSILE